MNFFEAVASGFRNYATVSGRATRPEYWWFFLYWVLAFVVATIVAGLLAETVAAGASLLVFGLLLLVNFIPLVAVSVRRLHDAGYTGWWVLLWFVPVFGLLVFILYALPSAADNPWGPGITPALDESEATLRARAESGDLPWAMLPFELAKIDLARTGRRRIFVCSRCGKAVSLAWRQCDHCKAIFGEFPPRDTGQIV